MTFEHVDEAFPVVDEPESSEDAPKRFTLYSAAQLPTLKAPSDAVRGVIPSEGIAALVGASGTAKSFLMLDLVARLAEAGTWFGHGIAKVHHAVILVLENEAGFRKRVKAWEIAKERPFPRSVKFVFDRFNLQDRNDTMALAEVIFADGGCDVLVIDTLNRATPGADENSSRDASLILENAKELQDLLGGLVLIVHHAGKDLTKGMRGHSSLYAAMDAVIEVARLPDRREWTLVKSKDDIDGAAHPFTLEQVEVGQHFTGEPITSCVVRSIDTPVDRTPRPPAGGNQRIIYTALCELLREGGAYGKPGAPPHRPCLQLDQAIEATKGRLAVEPKRQAERARLAINNMVATGVLGCSEGWIWLI